MQTIHITYDDILNYNVNVVIAPRLETLKITVPIFSNFPDVPGSGDAISAAVLVPTLRTLHIEKCAVDQRTTRGYKNKNAWIVNLNERLSQRDFLDNLIIEDCDVNIKIDDFVGLFQNAARIGLTQLTLKALRLIGKTWKAKAASFLSQSRIEYLDFRDIYYTTRNINYEYTTELGHLGIPFSGVLWLNSAPETLRELKINFTFSDAQTIVNTIPTSNITHLLLHYYSTTAEDVEAKTAKFTKLSEEEQCRILPHCQSQKERPYYYRNNFRDAVPYSARRLIPFVGELLLINQLIRLEIVHKDVNPYYAATYGAAYAGHLGGVSSPSIGFDIPDDNTTLEQISFTGAVITPWSQNIMMTNRIMSHMVMRIINRMFWFA